MRSRELRLTALFFCLCLVSVAVVAAPFEPLFRIKEMEGPCSVKTPTSSAFEDLIEGRAYHHGTKVRTGGGARAVLELSAGNECDASAATVVRVSESKKDRKLRIVELYEGKVRMSLEPGFEESNVLHIETPTATCQPLLGGSYEIQAKTEHDLKVVVIKCLEGKIRVFSPYLYNVPELEKDESISISGASDRSFVRLKNIRGSYDVHVKDSEGNPKVVETKPGWVIKIWRKISGSGDILIVTVLISSPDGTLQEAVTYSEQWEGSEAELTGAIEVAAAAPVKKDDGRSPEESRQEVKEENAPVTEIPDEDLMAITTTTTTTTTTTSTTTTTIPSPTPTGRR